MPRPDELHPRQATGWTKFKSYKAGKQAARKGEPRGTCPYQLTPEIRDLLLKRQRWNKGWEDGWFSKKRKKKK